AASGATFTSNTPDLLATATATSTASPSSGDILDGELDADDEFVERPRASFGSCSWTSRALPSSYRSVSSPGYAAELGLLAQGHVRRRDLKGLSRRGKAVNGAAGRIPRKVVSRQWVTVSKPPFNGAVPSEKKSGNTNHS